MNKQAYELGIELALRDAGLVKEAGKELTPHERANRLAIEWPGALGGAALGGLGGAAIGSIGGLGLSKMLDMNDRLPTAIGGTLGMLAGAGAGGYGGYRLGENLANSAVRHSTVGDVMHQLGVPPGGYDMDGPAAKDIRKKLIAAGILSG